MKGIRARSVRELVKRVLLLHFVANDLLAAVSIYYLTITNWRLLLKPPDDATYDPRWII